MPIATDDRPSVLVVTGEDSTADLVITELAKRRVPVARFDFAEFPDRLTIAAQYGLRAGGTLRTTSRVVDLDAVSAVYYRRPSWPKFDHLDRQDSDFAGDQARFGLEGVVHSLPNCTFVNHPRRQQAAEYKPAQLAVAADVGLAVPPTIVTNVLDEVLRFADVHGPVVYKPLWQTAYVVDGESRNVWVREVDPDELDESVAVTAHLFQSKVDKVADVRVTVVGARVFCVRIDSPLTDWRERYDLIERYSIVDPPSGLEPMLRSYLARFGLLYGCFDFGVDAIDGSWWFYECNPGGEWGWIAAETGLPIAQAFAAVLTGRDGRS